MMNQTGLAVAASNWQQPGTFIGQRYHFRDYFRAAIGGQTGVEFAIGATTVRPGIFFSYPVRSADQDVVGVLVVKIDLTSLNRSWNALEQQVMVVNDDGVVVITGQPEWRFRTTKPLSQDQRHRMTLRRQFADEPLTSLNLVELADDSIKLDAIPYLRVIVPIDWLDWKLWLMTSEELASRKAWATVSYASVFLLVIIATLGFVLSERFRSTLAISLLLLQYRACASGAR